MHIHTMDPKPLAAIEDAMRQFALQAGETAKAIHTAKPAASTKDNQTLNASNIVTEADRQIGAFAEELFPRLFPGAEVIQEETIDLFDPRRLGNSTLTFVVDPIDGTLFYAREGYAWTVSVGCFLGDTPIAGCINAPALDTIFYTQQGKSYKNGRQIQVEAIPEDLSGSIMLQHIKGFPGKNDFPGYILSLGSVALHLAMTASGYACCCVTNKHRLYDIAGSIKLLENAGVEFTYLDGSTPAWHALLTRPAERAPDYFLACPAGQGPRLRKFFHPT